MSADAQPVTPVAPRSYRLEDVRLTVQRAPGHGQLVQTLTLASAGNATMSHGREKQFFDFSDPQLLAAINAFYAMRFFDLPAKIGPRQSVFLKPDGSLGVQTLRPSDATYTTACFAVTGFEKCVAYAEGAGPKELEVWVQSSFADAVQRLTSSRK